MYNATDWLIDTINANSDAWGVTAEYCTASEYLAALHASQPTLPVKQDLQTFFPYNTWSGYFTSRPKLKGLSQSAHGSLHAAETLFGLRPPRSEGTKQQLWDLLESARRKAGVVQHHDAITGTPCSSQEGCAGVDQVMGSHNVLGVYEQMVSDAKHTSDQVSARILSHQTGIELGVELTEFGDVLMDQNPATLVVYNSLSSVRSEMVSLQVPICNVAVLDADGAPVKSQVTAQFTINDGVPPYYDFDLHFEARLQPLSYAAFTVLPIDSDDHCGGGDMARLGTNFSQHVPRWPPERAKKGRFSAVESMYDALVSDQRATQGLVGPLRTPPGQSQKEQGFEQLVVMENSFLKVYIDTAVGIQAVLDKGTGTNYSLTHQLLEYQSEVNDAYDFKPTGPAQPIGSSSVNSCRAGQCLVRVCPPSGAGCSFQLSSSDDCGPQRCVALHRSSSCDPHGPTQSSHSCDTAIDSSTAGYCECARKAVPLSCDSSTVGLGCNQLCGNPAPAPKLLASSVSLGAVMQEVRLQISAEHKTRIRLWVSDDPEVGGRLELAHRIGVLEERTEIVSRFSLETLASQSSLFSEDNGYETIEHQPGWDGDKASIPLRHWPSQMSAFLENSDSQFSVALDRSHGVASLVDGSLDVIQHRRGAPFDGSGGTVVLDDTDRILTQTWISIGNVSHANQLRHSNKLRLNHPLILLFGKGKTSSVDSVQGVESLPGNVYMQSIRATSSAADELLLRVMHVFGKGEQPVESASAVDVDLVRVVAPFRPTMVGFNETSLSGLVPRADMARVRWNAEGARGDGSFKLVGGEEGGRLRVNPFEFRTVVATQF
eukprot:TRINITY_DN4728_c0_g2_i1.p1 TRINITY_DN4728_c0_g2~~TRINITY_DN4728_c0_g2_i1.p1  ORF type:complete len:827 (+),score=171.69 TRINITY_DN4728_c0_g2_i1:274-2754(+)